MAVAVRVVLSLHAHAAVRRAPPQRALADVVIRRADGVSVFILPAGIDGGHHVHQVAAVEANRLIAV